MFEYPDNIPIRLHSKLQIEAETGREWSFRTVLARVCQLRDFFLKHGVCPGDHVALYAFNSLESYGVVWALVSIPAVVVLIRPIFKYRKRITASTR